MCPIGTGTTGLSPRARRRPSPGPPDPAHPLGRVRLGQRARHSGPRAMDEPALYRDQHFVFPWFVLLAMLGRLIDERRYADLEGEIEAAWPISNTAKPH